MTSTPRSRRSTKASATWPPERPVNFRLCSSHIPHACGERSASRASTLSVSGTSPRVWGEGIRRRPGRPADRCIPTRVGRGPGEAPWRCPWPVHPHACGERSQPCAFWVRRCGTSPRVWGEAGRAQRAGRYPRYIPTRVGRGHRQIEGAWGTPVHPHACGERWSGCGTSVIHCGTSPRVWGEVGPSRCTSVVHRYIPTRVGRGWERPGCACGAPPGPGRQRRTGTSPRVWGEARTVTPTAPTPRYIPTRVGRGRPRPIPASAQPVHPHACGERRNSDP